jgi:hypothetical protein
MLTASSLSGSFFTLASQDESATIFFQKNFQLEFQRDGDSAHCSSSLVDLCEASRLSTSGQRPIGVVTAWTICPSAAA